MKRIQVTVQVPRAAVQPRLFAFCEACAETAVRVILRLDFIQPCSVKKRTHDAVSTANR